MIEVSNINPKNELHLHMVHFGVCSKSAHSALFVFSFTETSICSSKSPRLTFVLCFGSPQAHFPYVSVSHSFSLPFVSFPRHYGLSSFPHVKQSLSICPPELIMRFVRELVASLESHGRQLHSEVGHMVRWVTRADSNTPRDDQRDQGSS